MKKILNTNVSEFLNNDEELKEIFKNIDEMTGEYCGVVANSKINNHSKFTYSLSLELVLLGKSYPLDLWRYPDRGVIEKYPQELLEKNLDHYKKEIITIVKEHQGEIEKN